MNQESALAKETVLELLFGDIQMKYTTMTEKKRQPKNKNEKQVHIPSHS